MGTLEKYQGRIKLLIPYVQLPALAITLAIGVKTGLGLIFQEGGPVLTWSPDEMLITDGPPDGFFEVTAVFIKRRGDCPVTGWSPRVIDSQGFAHAVTTTIGKTGAPRGDKATVRKHAVRILIPSQVAPGVATYEGLITYDCPEGQQVVAYPETMQFEITEQ